MKYIDWLAAEILGKQHEGPHCPLPNEIYDIAESIIKVRNVPLPDINIGMSDYDYFMAKAPVRWDKHSGKLACSWASDMLAESERRRERL